MPPGDHDDDAVDVPMMTLPADRELAGDVKTSVEKAHVLTIVAASPLLDAAVAGGYGHPPPNSAAGPIYLRTLSLRL